MPSARALGEGVGQLGSKAAERPGDEPAARHGCGSAADDRSPDLSALTRDDKIDLVSGRGLWRTASLPRHHIRSVLMTDGTNGVRFVPAQIDDVGEQADLGAFLDTVDTARGETALLLGRSLPMTCFPSGATMGCSWDTALMYEVGRALAAECRLLGVQVLLGPGINLRRCPLAGRGFEYCSEDPVLTADMAAGLINGLQDHGVGASLKHLACNNSEVERTSMDSVVERRALHELYLYGFERAIARSDPWTVMTSYNRLNGVQTSADPWLLTDIVRKRWGYRGTVISDWHGIQDRPASLLAGNDLDMPQSDARKRRLRTALAEGRVPDAALDGACRNVLRLIERCDRAAAMPPLAADFDAHHALARKIAARSCVLLVNRDDLLPLTATCGHWLVIGSGAMEPRIQGVGSAGVNPRQCDIPLDMLRQTAGAGVQLSYHAGWADDGSIDPQRRQEALEMAARADTVLVFAGTPPDVSGENADRPDLALIPAHDDFIAALAGIHPRVVVVLTHPDAVILPWVGSVGAVISAGYAGQGFGGAIADILLGVENPSGKLPVTWPARLEDSPAFLGYPGEHGTHLYREGIFVGYRYFDARRITPLFPFGFGLSYTRFSYHGLRLDRSVLGRNQTLSISFTIRNDGPVYGREICQLYLGRPEAPRRAIPAHPRRALKSFACVALAPGESRVVDFVLTRRDFAYFDVVLDEWFVPEAVLSIEIGASSRDILLQTELTVAGDSALPRRLDLHTPPGIVMETPHAAAELTEWLAAETGAAPAEALAILDRCRTSFLGLHDTLSWSLGRELDEGALIQVLERINRENGIP
ncbi:beta-glucosidase-related glycosidase [Gluconacetobacter sacchari DSM 12717]|uniref:Beta-glucosidase-related glycosidase n=1 Tax=Gluconacetobacter sacchari DSM 12717 TaxID=1307940 RepID=A0ABQ0P6C2_9PROT|nr:glycoside hydrolase family 3 C-terminal domain-containing protein [Gluconacetobacter sacchari]GBQ23773.1 beta-glucosidase-related glycosidase [Gluconacetobacter sacchari DSM 12717]